MTAAIDPDRMTAPAEPTAVRRPTRTVEVGVIVAARPTDQRALLLARRQALIIELGAIEEYLGMERSIVPRRKR